MILEWLMDILQSHVGGENNDLIHLYHFRKARVILQENHCNNVTRGGPWAGDKGQLHQTRLMREVERKEILLLHITKQHPTSYHVSLTRVVRICNHGQPINLNQFYILQGVRLRFCASTAGVRTVKHNSILPHPPMWAYTDRPTWCVSWLKTIKQQRLDIDRYIHFAMPNLNAIELHWDLFPTKSNTVV